MPSRVTTAHMSERVIKFRSVGPATEDDYTTLKIRSVDRYELIRGGVVRLPDGAECLVNLDSWETIRVADGALEANTARTIDLPLCDDVPYEYIARVNIRNPFDPDTWDWRDVVRLAPVSEAHPSDDSEEDA